MLPLPFIAFLGALSLFHCSEFLLAAVYMRHELSWNCKHQNSTWGTDIGRCEATWATRAYLLSE